MKKEKTFDVGNYLEYLHPPQAVEYWVSQASKGRNIAECWQAIYQIIQQEKEKIYIALMKIADANEEEFMRREIIRYFSKK